MNAILLRRSVHERPGQRAWPLVDGELRCMALTFAAPGYVPWIRYRHDGSDPAIVDREEALRLLSATDTEAP